MANQVDQADQDDQIRVSDQGRLGMSMDSRIRVTLTDGRVCCSGHRNSCIHASRVIGAVLSDALNGFAKYALPAENKRRKSRFFAQNFFEKKHPLLGNLYFYICIGETCRHQNLSLI